MKKEEELTTNDLAEKVDGLASTIGTLANRMDAGFAEIRKEMAGGFVKVENDNNDFAIAVAKGFDEVNEKFDGVDSRFNNIDNQIKTLNSKFDLHDGEFKILRSQMGKGFRELQKEYEDIKSRLERIE
ncbi:MAG: hypothetical protein NTY30_03355, partial [Candidatus Berkelbacteria bacterium]|nr:hypothetical protein [Candidatus Berkelbacteria bacterium]